MGGSGYTQPEPHHNLFAQPIASVVAWSTLVTPTLWFDRLHSNDSGHQQIADHLAP